MKITAALTFLLALPATTAFSPVVPTTVGSSTSSLNLGLPPNNQDNQGLEKLFGQNQAWKQQKLEQDPDFFNNLGTTHTPEFMWIGCADARVPPNLITQEDAGNLFVHRNVANMVVNTDTNLLSAMQYAVLHLKVQHIVVCGHYECGGVRAAEANQDLVAPLELWLKNIRDVYAKNSVELDAIEDADDRHRRFVELNTIQQAVNVLKCGNVQQRRKETLGDGVATPQVHAMVFDPKTGDLKRLDIDFAKFEGELNNVYGMHLVD